MTEMHMQQFSCPATAAVVDGIWSQHLHTTYFCSIFLLVQECIWQLIQPEHCSAINLKVCAHVGEKIMYWEERATEERGGSKDSGT